MSASPYVCQWCKRTLSGGLADTMWIPFRTKPAPDPGIPQCFCKACGAVRAPKAARPVELRQS